MIATHKPVSEVLHGDLVTEVVISVETGETVTFDTPREADRVEHPDLITYVLYFTDGGATVTTKQDGSVTVMTAVPTDTLVSVPPTSLTTGDRLVGPSVVTVSVLVKLDDGTERTYAAGDEVQVIRTTEQ